MACGLSSDCAVERHVLRPTARSNQPVTLTSADQSESITVYFRTGHAPPTLGEATPLPPSKQSKGAIMAAPQRKAALLALPFNFLVLAVFATRGGRPGDIGTAALKSSASVEGLSQW
jgi:hypothetical protein